DLPQGSRIQPDDLPGIEDGVQVTFRKPEIFQGQGRLILSSVPYRVGRCEKMAPGTITRDQLIGLELIEQVLRHFLSRSIGKGGRAVGAHFDAQVFQGSLRPEIKALKKSPPTGLYTIGTRLVFLVKLRKK